MADSSLMATVVNIFASPAEAFRAIKERPRAFLPWALVIASTVTVTVLYINLVDFAWFMEQQLRSSNAAQNMTDAQLEQAITAASNTPRGVIAAAAGISTPIALTLIWFVFALYFKVVSSITRDGIRLKQWFSLICWCSLPALLSSLAALVNLLTNDVSLMPQTKVNPLSYSSLFNIEPTGTNIFFRILQSFDLTSIWALVLTVLGYQNWTGKSLTTAAAIALAPYALVLGLGLLVSFL